MQKCLLVKYKHFGILEIFLLPILKKLGPFYMKTDLQKRGSNFRLGHQKKISNIFLDSALQAQQNEVPIDPVGQVSFPTSGTSLCPYNFFGLFYFVLGSLPVRFGSVPQNRHRHWPLPTSPNLPPHFLISLHFIPPSKRLPPHFIWTETNTETITETKRFFTETNAWTI